MNMAKWMLLLVLSVVQIGGWGLAAAGEGQPANPADEELETLLRDAKDPSVATRAAAMQKLSTHDDARAVQALLTALQSDEDDGVRFLATYNLSRKGAVVVPSLKELLASDQPQIRARVVETLSKMEDAARKEPLILALLDRDEQIARQAYAGLTRYESEPSIPPLAPLLIVIEKGGVFARSSAAVLLSDCQDAAAVAPLLHMLQNDLPDVRPYAANAFTRIKESKAVAPLLEALNDDKNALLRSQAALALGTQADPAAVAPLLTRLQDDDGEVRKSAVLALGKIGDRRALAPLIPFLQDQPLETRIEAIWAIAALGGAEAFDALLPRLKDGENSERIELAAALGRCGDPRAFEPLAALLEGNDLVLVNHAVKGLGYLRDKRSVMLLLDDRLWKQVPATDGVLAGTIRTALEQICGESLEPLIAAAMDPDAATRAHAVWALNSLGGDAQLERIMDASKDAAPEVRMEAAEILAFKKGTKDFDVLLSLLKDPHAGVRCQAAWSLGERKDAKAVEPLIAALQDLEPRVRSRAADSLGHFMDKRVIRPLVAALKDSDADVRYFAKQSLQALKYEVEPDGK